MTRATALFATFLLPWSAYAADGQLGLFFNPTGSTCDITIPCNCTGTLYVYALLEGATAGGIAGAEYKIATGPDSNADPGWIFIEHFGPSTVVMGSGALTPVDPAPRGVYVGFPTCGQGDGFKVLIETVEIFHVDCMDGSFPELHLRGVKHDNPSNAALQCPLFVLCDEPIFTKVCAGGVMLCPAPQPPGYEMLCSTSGQAWINPKGSPCCPTCPPVEADCTVELESSSWTRLKALYRD